jgi:hypothetical protein
MFRLYDHLQVEIYLLQITLVPTVVRPKHVAVKWIINSKNNYNNVA